jgi:hypothetical protein
MCQPVGQAVHAIDNSWCAEALAAELVDRGCPRSLEIGRAALNPSISVTFRLNFHLSTEFDYSVRRQAKELRRIECIVRQENEQLPPPAWHDGAP